MSFQMLSFDGSQDRVLNVLCLGAHCDDITIGCGGTLLHLLHRYPRMKVWWVAFCADSIRGPEEQQAVTRLLKGAGDPRVVLEAYRDGFLPSQTIAVKETFERLKPAFSPDLIFTHYGADRHQDHRVISELTWNTYRHHCILEYEIPKYDGDFGSPNVYVPLTEGECERKIQAVLESYPSQLGKHWFADEVFRALARLRGMETGGESRYAEAFYARKLLVG